MAKMKCSFCKKELEETNRTCPHCGETTVYGKYITGTIACYAVDFIFCIVALYAFYAMYSDMGDTLTMLVLFFGAIIAILICSIVNFILSKRYRKVRQELIIEEE